VSTVARGNFRYFDLLQKSLTYKIAYSFGEANLEYLSIRNNIKSCFNFFFLHTVSEFSIFIVIFYELAAKIQKMLATATVSR